MNCRWIYAFEEKQSGSHKKKKKKKKDKLGSINILIMELMLRGP